MTAATNLNRGLAAALGWTNIIELGGALLGKPPGDAPQCREQAKVPDWAGDWRDCGPLMVKYDVGRMIGHSQTDAEARSKIVATALACIEMEASQ